MMQAIPGVAGLALTAFVLSACSSGVMEENPEPIGDFRLGHTVISEENAEKAPISRESEPGLLKDSLHEAVVERLGRYRGRSWYHISISIDAYSLSGGGIPVIASPRSALALRVTIWDDATAERLNVEPHLLTVLEPTSPETVIGSGLVRTPEEQAEALAFYAAELIERWLKSPESPLPKRDGEPDAGSDQADPPPQ